MNYKILLLLPLFFLDCRCSAMEITSVTKDNKKIFEANPTKTKSGFKLFSRKKEIKSPEVNRGSLSNDTYKTDKDALKRALMEVETLVNLKNNDSVERAVEAFEELNKKYPNIVYKDDDFITPELITSLSKAYEKLGNQESAKIYTCLASLKSIKTLLEIKEKDQTTFELLKEEATLLSRDEYTALLEDNKFSSGLIDALSTACSEVELPLEARYYTSLAALKSIKTLLAIKEKDQKNFETLQKKVTLLSQEEYKQFLTGNLFSVELSGTIQRAKDFFATPLGKQHTYCSVLNAVENLMGAESKDGQRLLQKIFELEMTPPAFFWQDTHVDTTLLSKIAQAYVYIKDNNLVSGYDCKQRAYTQYIIAEQLKEKYEKTIDEQVSKQYEKIIGEKEVDEKAERTEETKRAKVREYYMLMFAQSAQEYQKAYSATKSPEIGAILTDIEYRLRIEDMTESVEYGDLNTFLHAQGIIK